MTADTTKKNSPVRAMVVLHGGAETDWCFELYQADSDTHRITFDMIDGKPDPDSIRMEEL